MGIIDICDFILSDGFLKEEDIAIINEYTSLRTCMDDYVYEVLRTNKYIRFWNTDMRFFTTEISHGLSISNTCCRYNDTLYNFSKKEKSESVVISITDIVKELDVAKDNSGTTSSKDISIDDSYDEVQLSKFLNEFRGCDNEDMIGIVKFIKLSHMVKALYEKGTKLSVLYHLDSRSGKKIIYGYSLAL